MFIKKNKSSFNEHNAYCLNIINLRLSFRGQESGYKTVSEIHNSITSSSKQTYKIYKHFFFIYHLYSYKRFKLFHIV